MPIYFSTPLQELPITLESVGNRWVQEEICRPSGHPHYHWLLTEKGCGKIEVNGETILLEPGCGILLAPHVPHSYRRQSETWETAFVTFAGPLEAEMQKITNNRPVLYVPEHSTLSFRAWVDEMVGAYEAHRPPEPVQLSVDCYGFLLRLARYQDGDLQEQPLFARYVQPVLARIEADYGDPITVQDLAGSVYISPQYLSRLFNRYFGCSAYAYLTSFRLGKAKELLIGKPHLSVQLVASMTGYLDTSHFIAMFKKATGLTPLEFRKTYMQGTQGTAFSGL